MRRVFALTDFGSSFHRESCANQFVHLTLVLRHDFGLFYDGAINLQMFFALNENFKIPTLVVLKAFEFRKYAFFHKISQQQLDSLHLFLGKNQ